MSLKLPLWGTILTIIGVAVLCFLGTWQLERLQWKQDLIMKLEAAYEGDGAQPLMLDKDFSYGFVRGVLLSDKAILIGPRTHNDKIGRDVIVPLSLGDQTLLVNMGFTMEEDVTFVPIHDVKGQIIGFTGLLRHPSWNSFTPDNQPDKNAWYKLDPQEIGAVKGLSNVLPYVLYAQKSDYEFAEGLPQNSKTYPNNNHLQYAFFWYVMAVAMIGVYAFRFVLVKKP